MGFRKMRTVTHTVFLGLRPPPDVVPAIGQAAESLKAMKLIRGSWVKPVNYHITLHFFGNYLELPMDILERIKAAAAEISFAPFTMTFDRISSFRGKRQSPCILLCAHDSDAALQSFWRELGKVLKAHKLEKHLESRLTPHITLAYADKPLAQSISIAPITWTADGFVLLDSLVGAGTHNELARWPLV